MPRQSQIPHIAPERITLLRTGENIVELGGGAFGTVYAGLLDAAHAVAIKQPNGSPLLTTLPVSVQSSKDAHERHLVEANSQLVHEWETLWQLQAAPGVVRIFGRCGHAIVMERLQTRAVPTDASGRARLCADVATALAGVHGLGAAHGDVKLANVLFGSSARLIDFGLACAHDTETETAGRGSAAFLAPEGWGAVRKVDDRQRMDVYALGMLLYEAFCGPPWAGVEGVCLRVLAGERPAWPPHVDDRVAEIARACWLHDPAARPRAAAVGDEMRAIERALVAEGADGAPIGPPAAAPLPEPHMYDARGNNDATANKDACMTPADDPQSVLQHTPPPSHSGTVDGSDVAQVVRVSDCDSDSALLSASRNSIMNAQLTARAVNPRLPLPQNHPLPPPQPDHDLEHAAQHISDDEFIAAATASTNSASHHSSGYLPDASQPNTATLPTELPQSRITSSAAPPSTSDYPYKHEIATNDLAALTALLTARQADPPAATLVLEAITVLLETPPNPHLFAPALPTLCSLVSRGTTPRLAKAACLIVHRLATAPTPETERALRVSSAYDVLSTSLKRHPSHLPVVQAATAAIHALCAASSALCSIVVDQKAANAVLRSLSRATRSFRNDVPVAVASLSALAVMARSHAPRLVEAGVIEAMLSTVTAFSHPRVDSLAIPVVAGLVRSPGARTHAVSHAPAVAAAIARASDLRVLLHSYNILSELAREGDGAANSFAGSAVVQPVVESIEDRIDGDERLVLAGLTCLTAISSLGGDACGTLEMLQVFDLVYNIVNARPDSRAMGLAAVVFLEQILKELRNASHSVNLDLPFSMLVQIQKRWEHDPIILRHANNAVNDVRHITGRAVPLDEPQTRSSLRSFVKKFSSRKPGSLRVGGS